MYHPETFKQLNLDICKNLKIEIYSPVSFDKETSQLFSSLNEYGYNLFNDRDPFYNDICSPYTTQNGTDILLLDRKIDIYSKTGNKTLCQTGCELLFYNETIKKAKCSCSVQSNEEPDLYSGFKFDKKEIAQNFYKTLSNSNFLVLKCYKVAFDIKALYENIGRIIMTVFIFIIFILLIIYCFIGNKQKNLYLQKILNQKFSKNNKEGNMITSIKKKNNSSNRNNQNKKKKIIIIITLKIKKKKIIIK